MQDDHRSACGEPEFERSLLDLDAQARWAGFPVAWIASSPHDIEADLVTERDGLVMVDSGAVQADFRYANRSASSRPRRSPCCRS